MRRRIILGSLLPLCVLAAGTVATGEGVAPARQWAITSFSGPVIVTNQTLTGPYSIVHDDARMERGEPRTTFYRLDPGRGPREEGQAFHRRPANRPLVDKLTFTQTGPVGIAGIPRVTACQFAGDRESHGIPTKP